MSAAACAERRASYSVPSVTRDAVLRALRLGLEPLQAQPPQRLADWARDHFVLSADSSHRKGQWHAWPFQVGWLDAFSNDDIRQVDVRKAKRTGYTKCIVAFIGYHAAHRRRKLAVYQPTDDDRDSFVRTEVEPMLDEVPAVRNARRTDRGEDTIKLKAFRGSVQHYLGGKAARAYRRITVDTVLMDEVDGFDQQVEKSADPPTLARGRLEGAPFPKLVMGTTPRLKGQSHIERQEQQADAVMRYRIPCPLCDEEHPLEWGSKESAWGLKWDNSADKPEETVRHVCPHCRGAIVQADYLRVWHLGAWVCDATSIRYGADRVWRNAAGAPIRPPRHVAFVEAWAAYSPQRTWSDIVLEGRAALQAKAQGDDGPLQGFTNETLARCYELQGESADEHALQRRAEPYAVGLVPKGALVLTAGIDVQGDRWEIAVWGWARGLESWLVDHVVVHGNPFSARDWELLLPHLQRSYPQAWHGGALGIDAISIDANYATQPVCAFVHAQRSTLRIHAVRGGNEEGKPIKGTATPYDVKFNGQTFRHGIKLWTIGVDTAKDLLHGQLAIQEPGPGYVHFSSQSPREIFEQITAEQRVQVRSATGTQLRWVKRRPRNEQLDCRNYALHAALMLGVDKWTEARWAAIEAAVQPPADLFSAVTGSSAAGAIQLPAAADAGAAAAAAPVQPAPVPPRRLASSSISGREW